MKRISDHKTAHNFVRQLIQNDSTRASKRVKISGMIDGNPPFDPKKMKAAGQGKRCNVNFREAEGIINARNAAIYELFFDSRYLIDSRLINGIKYQGHAYLYEAIMKEEITRFLKKWNAFLYEMQSVVNSKHRHGVGTFLWLDRNSWKPKSFQAGEVLFPKNTKANPDYINACAVLDDIDVSVLYEKIADDLKESKWDNANVKAAINAAVKGKAFSGEDRWEEVQKGMEEDSLGYDSEHIAPIKCAHVLVQEEDKISHYIVERGKECHGFLYKDEEAYDSFIEACIPFICNIGNGSYHSIKGIGHRIYQSVLVNNRFLCKAVDSAMDASSLVISYQAGTARSSRSVRLGNEVLLPPGAKLEQNRVDRNLQGTTGIYSLMTQVNQANIGIERPGLGVLAKDDASKHTARGESIAAIKEARLEKQDVNLYYSQLDLFYEQLMKRILSSDEKDAVAFRTRLVDRGIPSKMLSPEYWDFKAPRIIGGGSSVMRNIVTNELLAIAPHLPEIGQRELLADHLEARVSPETILRYLPTFDPDAIPTQSHQFAQLENNDLVEGRACIVAVDNWHVTHATTHLDYFESYVSRFFENPDEQKLPETMSALSVALDHIGSHLAYLQGDEMHESKMAELENRLKALVGQVKKVQQHYQAFVQQQRKAQEEENARIKEAIEKGDTAELQKELAKIQADKELRIYKENQNHEVRVAKAKHGMMISEALAASKIENEKRKATASTQ